MSVHVQVGLAGSKYWRAREYISPENKTFAVPHLSRFLYPEEKMETPQSLFEAARRGISAIFAACWRQVSA